MAELKGTKGPDTLGLRDATEGMDTIWGYEGADETFILMQTGTSTDVEGVIRLSGIVVPQAGWFEL